MFLQNHQRMLQKLIVSPKSCFWVCGKKTNSLNCISLVTSTAATSILLLFNYTSSDADYWHRQVLLDLIQLPSHQGRFGLVLKSLLYLIIILLHHYGCSCKVWHVHDWANMSGFTLSGCPTQWDAIRKIQARLGKKMSSKWGGGGGQGEEMFDN